MGQKTPNNPKKPIKAKNFQRKKIIFRNQKHNSRNGIGTGIRNAER